MRVVGQADFIFFFAIEGLEAINARNNLISISFTHKNLIKKANKENKKNTKATHSVAGGCEAPEATRCQLSAIDPINCKKKTVSACSSTN